MSSWDRKESRLAKNREFDSQIVDALDYSDEDDDEDGDVNTHVSVSSNQRDYHQLRPKHSLQVPSQHKSLANPVSDINAKLDKLTQLTSQLKKTSDQSINNEDQRREDQRRDDDKNWDDD